MRWDTPGHFWDEPGLTYDSEVAPPESGIPMAFDQTRRLRPAIVQQAGGGQEVAHRSIEAILVASTAAKNPNSPQACELRGTVSGPPIPAAAAELSSRAAGRANRARGWPIQPKADGHLAAGWFAG